VSPVELSEIVFEATRKNIGPSEEHRSDDELVKKERANVPDNGPEYHEDSNNEIKDKYPWLQGSWLESLKVDEGSIAVDLEHLNERALLVRLL
jgi:hypothetical protein